ncbi:hypothetical protein KKC13_13700, partial [bacterium]|nr:hypothetical protein [bacterium]
TEYNYTFCNTTPIGTYTVNGVGDLSGTDTVWNYNFEITDTGKPYLTVSGTESMSVTLFIILLTIALFLIGIKVKLSGNPVANIIFKRLFIMGGLYLLSLDAAIIVTIAGSVGLGLEQELFLLLWLINMVIYIFMIFIVITTIFNVLKMINKMAKLKRMGNYGNENEYY